ncbi:MAG: transcription elongation factor GreA [Alphaproteobacteria bacterium]|nr:transcription elongation factor GreA [Alphaproteobacteria bacterium]
MDSQKRPISRAGFDALAAELKQLKEIEMPAIHKAVAAARELGDLSENAEYSSAREKQRHVNKRMNFIESVISNAEIIDTANLSGDRIIFGAYVVAEDEDGKKIECQILSDIEADGKSVISCTSPFGRALIGKCVGDSCTVKTPSGDKEYDILSVEFK